MTFSPVIANHTNFVCNSSGRYCNDSFSCPLDILDRPGDRVSPRERLHWVVLRLSMEDYLKLIDVRRCSSLWAAPFIP